MEVDDPLILKFLLHTHMLGGKVRVFLCGDYEFLCRMFGISGASGKYHGLHCNKNLATAYIV